MKIETERQKSVKIEKSVLIHHNTTSALASTATQVKKKTFPPKKVIGTISKVAPNPSHESTVAVESVDIRSRSIQQDETTSEARSITSV